MNNPDQLRQLGIDCAVLARSESDSWAAEVSWLKALPICWATAEKRCGVDSIEGEDEPCLFVGIDGKPVDADSLPLHMFSITSRENEVGGQQGPILRRLLNGWAAATYRFLRRPHGGDRYCDFGVGDARRIALLAALTFNKDFDGREFGLDWEWEHPPDSPVPLEGRNWARACLTGGRVPEEMLVEVIGVAIDFLQRLLPAIPEHHSPTERLPPQNDETETEPGRMTAEAGAERMRPSSKRAGQSLAWVKKKRPDLTPEKAACSKAQYDYICEYECLAYSTDRPPPSYETWARYVRDYNFVTNGPRQSPRGGRTGGSIVRSSDI